MKLLATMMLMVALVTMTVQTASADFQRPPCPSQMRVENMCYAAAVPAAAAESAKKGGGICCDLFPATPLAQAGVGPADHWLTEMTGRTSLFIDRYLWRPPRA